MSPQLVFAPIIMLLVLVLCTLWVCLAHGLHPDAGLDILKLAAKYGYPMETHQVTTSDGYILTLHRIPRGRNTTEGPHPPILLMHGLLSSSVDWINMGPGKALGLLLADTGYDVWLGNQRGTTWSRKHSTIDPDVNPEKFFDFSFHEIGIYDLPACVDYVLETTQTKKISYVGHSQGTTIFFVMASEKPEYNAKVHLMVALSPVAYVGNMPNPFIAPVVDGYDLITTLVQVLKINEFLPHHPLVSELGNVLCSEGSRYQEICVWILNIIGGFDGQIEPDFIPVITSNAPAGCSIKQVLHFIQGMRSQKFAQYDYGDGNKVKYDQETPPLYDVSKITAPMSFYYGNNDWLNAVEDVFELADQLPNKVPLNSVPLAQFNHLDFLWARNVVDLLYNNVINEITTAHAR